MGDKDTFMNALVTGGSGFIGGALVRRLLSEGVTVHTFQRSPAEDLRRLGAIVHPGDLQCGDDIREALTGVDTVFHVAAKVGIWGRWQEFFRYVLGTRNLLAMCREVGVRRVMYTDTPVLLSAENLRPALMSDSRTLRGFSVTTHIRRRSPNKRSLPQMTASLPRWPEDRTWFGDQAIGIRFPGWQNSALGRASCVFRATGRNRIDCTYIDNAIDADLLAAEKLDINAACAGRPYFVTNGEPLPILDVIN